MFISSSPEPHSIHTDLWRWHAIQGSKEVMSSLLPAVLAIDQSQAAKRRRCGRRFWRVQDRSQGLRKVGVSEFDEFGCFQPISTTPFSLLHFFISSSGSASSTALRPPPNSRPRSMQRRKRLHLKESCCDLKLLNESNRSSRFLPVNDCTFQVSSPNLCKNSVMKFMAS